MIHLDDHLVTYFLSSARIPHPYSLLVFFNIAQLRSKPDLRLPNLFSKSSSSLPPSLPSTPPPITSSSTMLFQISQASSFTSHPHIHHVGPHHHSLDDCNPMDQSDFSCLIELIAEFIQAMTTLPVVPIVRPPMSSPRQIALSVVALLISVPFLTKMIHEGNMVLHDRRLWLAVGNLLSIKFHKYPKLLGHQKIFYIL